MTDDPEILAAATIVAVSDVRASVAFYVDTLGFELRFETDEGDFAVVRRGPAVLQLTQTDDADALRATANNVAVYVWVRDVDALFKQLRVGLEALPQGRLRPPFDQDYGMREFHVKDPDGCLLFFGESV